MNKYEGFIGKVLDGRYKILELVGLGGMACVLKAQDLLMNRVVAIKILNDEYNGNESAEARFIDESKAVAMLSNKNIVSVYDVAIYPDIKYIVMEYLDGITLREYLDNKGAIEWKEACIYILQILRGLEHAHSKGIIHRDIKPQNVMLMKNGDIKVTDFGIAKLPDSVSEQGDEKAVGTVYYISPEQACGKQTDYYSDIYSVGVMFYEAVTGTLPFTADTPMEIAMMQVNDEPVHPRDIVLDIPVGVSQIILKAMEKSPDERFKSAHVMAKAIEWVLKHPDVIFSMNSSSSDDAGSGSNLVSIDMISTAELEPYKEDKITESLEKGKKEKQPLTQNQKVKKHKRARRSRSMFPIIFAISLAFFIVLVGIVWNLVQALMTSEADSGYEITIEDITGEIYGTTLINNLRNGEFNDCGYKYVFADDAKRTEYNENLPDGYIISTTPEPGKEYKLQSKKDPIIFTQVVVNENKRIIVPNLLFGPQKEAETQLANLGVKFETVFTSDAKYTNYFAGQVVEVSPECGREIGADELVTITVYKPNTNRTFSTPNLLGLTENEAKALCNNMRDVTSEDSHEVIIVKTKEVDNADNRVYEQYPAPGTEMKLGDSITIYISVPKPTFIMPGLKGLTRPEVDEALYQAAPEAELNIEYIYYTLPKDNETSFKWQTWYDSSFEKISSVLTEFATTGKASRVYEYDGLGKVYVQSISAGTETQKSEDKIQIIFLSIVDTPALPENNGGTAVTP